MQQPLLGGCRCIPHLRVEIGASTLKIRSEAVQVAMLDIFVPWTNSAFQLRNPIHVRDGMAWHGMASHNSSTARRLR